MKTLASRAGRGEGQRPFLFFATHAFPVEEHQHLFPECQNRTKYYYDAFNRRRLKVYPAGPMDESFHDLTDELIFDQGNDSVTSPTWYPTDEYVWLGDRPAILIRSKFNTSWARQADLTGDCTRNADPAPCGFYFPVSDTIGKPVLMLDASRRVTGATDYDIFGLPNRVSLDKETAHPYANNSNIILADFIQPLGGAANPSIQVRVRAVFDLVDTEGPAGNPADYFYLKDPDGGSALTGHLGGVHVGQLWTAWVIPSAGRVQVPFVSNATGNTYSGVVMSGYEYQRFQTGAQPFWTPLGFPGQSRDAETDLFQNWNRFYDASIGRYLESEPMLRNPSSIKSKALHGTDLPAFSYAQSNPVLNTDSTGFFVPGAGCSEFPTPGECIDAASKIKDNDPPANTCPDGLKKCIEAGCRANAGPKLVCTGETSEGKSVSKTCVPSDAGGGGDVGGWSPFGYCEGPAKEIIWCKRKISSKCQAQAMVHEIAHTCGWGHDDGFGLIHNKTVPGHVNGQLQCDN